MMQFAPQLIVIIYTIVRMMTSFFKIRYDFEKNTARKVGQVIGTFLYYFICHWVLWAGGFYQVFEQ